MLKTLQDIRICPHKFFLQKGIWEKDEMISYMKMHKIDLYWQITFGTHVLQITKKIMFLRRNLARHFSKVQGHQRNMVLNRTFDVPYSGRKRPKQDTILRSVTEQIGGSGFRLKSFFMIHIPKACHCVLGRLSSKYLLRLEVSHMHTWSDMIISQTISAWRLSVSQTFQKSLGCKSTLP